MTVGGVGHSLRSVPAERELEHLVGTLQTVKVSAGTDEAFELVRRNRDTGDDAANSLRFFVEVSDELTTCRMSGKAATVLQMKVTLGANNACVCDGMRVTHC
jgi:hypothetical protein